MCEKRREAGIKSGIVRRKAKDEQVLNNANTSEQMLTSINKMNQEKEEEKEKENEKENDIFIYNQEKEPEIDEIKKYITENNLKIDGEEFLTEGRFNLITFPFREQTMCGGVPKTYYLN